MELTEHDKDRIRLEETYRHQVRIQFEGTAKKPPRPIAAFLNSAFGLWLLSAVFVSGAGTLYQRWEQERDEGRARLEQALAQASADRQAIERLDVEISFRLSEALLALSTVSHRVQLEHQGASDEARERAKADATAAILSQLREKPEDARDGIYPEHAGYSLPTLLIELRRRLPRQQRMDVDTSLASLAALSASSESTDEPPTSASARAARTLHDKVLLARWKGTQFHFVDCSPKHPFC